MKAEPARSGALGVDTVSVITSATAKALKDAGYAFVIRYLGSVTAGELAGILSVGLAFMPVTFSRGPGWIPSASLGASDGKSSVQHALALGLPKGVTIWLDLEGPGGTYVDVIAYVNAWAYEISIAGFDPGLYVGAGCLLTSAELYALAVDRYWHSCSRVVDRFGNEAGPSCGWTIIQLVPNDVVVAGADVDRNVIQDDYRGRSPIWLA